MLWPQTCSPRVPRFDTIDNEGKSRGAKLGGDLGEDVGIKEITHMLSAIGEEVALDVTESVIALTVTIFIKKLQL